MDTRLRATKRIPKIDGEWRLLYQPTTTGCYVNDHSLIRAHDGSWHLFGITRDEPEVRPDRERWFTHGFGPKLISETGLQEAGIVCDNGVRAWAPSVVSDGRRYYMHYGPSPLRFATSDELGHWMENPVYLHDGPLDACHRDPMLLHLPDGSWLMYATGIAEGQGVVSVYASSDLVHWRFVRFALTTPGHTAIRPAWGATESPFVVALDGYYYLFITHTDCRPENYHNTLVFRSADPLDFGAYTEADEAQRVIARLHAHSPEIVRDEDGTWYITTCGWRNFGTPIEGGVAIARLKWLEAHD